MRLFILQNPTLQNKVFEQLKQGKLRWYDAVDLHGSSIDDARKAVLLLISQAINHGETVVKIVHGKGKDAILKTCVNGWLRQMPEVMAFVSAPAKDGAMVQYWYYSKSRPVVMVVYAIVIT